jgi:acetylornithine deacetylase/succinyl-diaminopimelate desuccinylase-like protein
VLGPGSLAQAHMPNEFVDIKELKASKVAFKSIIKGF